MQRIHVQEFNTRAYGVIYLPPGCSVDAEAFTITSSDAAYTRDEDAWGFTASFNVSLEFFTEETNATTLSSLVSKAHATMTVSYTHLTLPTTPYV